MLYPLDGPSLHGNTSVTDSSVFRVKVGAEELVEREVVSICPIDGKIWVLFGDGQTTPTVQFVKENGFPQRKEALRTYEAANTQEIYVVADTGTVKIHFAERG